MRGCIFFHPQPADHAPCATTKVAGAVAASALRDPTALVMAPVARMAPRWMTSRRVIGNFAEFAMSTEVYVVLVLEEQRRSGRSLRGAQMSCLAAIYNYNGADL